MFVPTIFSSEASGPDTGDIGHSLRLRSAASAYLSKTFNTPTNANKWTLSLWVKRGNLTAYQYLLNADTGAQYTYIAFDTNGTLDFYDTTSTGRITTTRVFRDPTAAVNLVFAYDSAQSTAADKLKLYINGVLETAFSIDTRASFGTGATRINTTLIHQLGAFVRAGGNYLDGYLSRIAFIDGQALTPSSFGYQNTQINEWVSKSQSAVKAVVDAGGTNSFMLDFDDGTSLTTLGYDKSSKGNNWTLNNVSLTAGSTYDWMLDVPGNSYCVMNPLKKNPTLITASDGNLLVTNSGDSSILGSIGMSSGKWYWEVTLTNNGTNGVVGVSTDAATLSQEVGGANNSWGYIGATGNKYSGAVNSAYGSAYTTNDVIGITYDVDTGTLTFYKNNVSQGAAYTGLSSSVTMFPAVGNSNASYACNFGQRPFAYTPPTGYKALCQANLPDPAILNPEKHFDVLLHTGNAVQDRAITGAAFDPDFAWIKNRGAAATHVLFDRVRGGDKQLFSNLTNAEQTNTDITNGFTTGGVIVGDNITGTGSTNQNTNTYVDWLWKAGGAAVTNNNGSISSQVSANVLAGQSVVTYIGNGGTATIGHGLTRAPELIHVKSRDDSIDGWYGYHASLGATKGIFLNLSSAAITSSMYWNDTAPTTSVFTVKGPGVTNRNGDDYVALCFHSVPGYSKVGSYIGNGSTDGPYVECGFKPKYVLVKRSDSTGNWQIIDAVRDTYNPEKLCLLANGSASESSSRTIDFTAGGFKVRETDTDVNASGGTYIFYAVADVPAKYSLAR